MSLISFLSALSGRDPRLDIDFGKATEEALSKEAPVGADVHVSTALGEKPKKKGKRGANDDGGDDSDNGASAHLPVTNMTLAAQQITGQSRQATKFEQSGKAKQTTKFAEVLKVDDSLGLVLGWAIVCKKDGCDYFDLQEDNIPEASMLSAAVDFMQNSRMAKEMHAGGAAGTVVFAFPLTQDIAKAFGIETNTSGLMIAMKPDSDEMLAKFRNGELTGFSIGGHRIHDEDVAA